jgi:hypothetical protein
MRLLKGYWPFVGAHQIAVSGRADIASRSATRLVAWCALLLAASPVSHASVSLLLEQPYGKLNLFESAGHAAIYLDHVCAETPLKLRACAAGELGVVISRYNGIGPYDWVAIPLIPYLYAVRSVSEIPETMGGAGARELREAYRREYLRSLAPDMRDGGAPGGNWYELVGSAFDRQVYEFRVKSTDEQDARLIARFNDSRNVERYDGMFRNCADFARIVLNEFYPHAVRREYLAGLGLTWPKSVARSLVHYGHRHPEIGLQIFVIPQVKGSIARSHGNDDVAEYILKRYGLPLLVVSPASAAVVLVAYLSHGRFSLPRNLPSVNFDEIEHDNSDRAVFLSLKELNLDQPAASTNDRVGVTGNVLAIAGSPASASAPLLIATEP